MEINQNDKLKEEKEPRTIMLGFSYHVKQNSTKFNNLIQANKQEGALGAKNGAVANENEQVEQERTRITKRVFIEYFKKTLGSIKLTCEKVGIDRGTYYGWLKNDAGFRLNIANCWGEKLEDVEQQINKKMIEGDGPMIRYFCDRRHPAYKPKVRVEGPTPGDKSIEGIFEEMEFIDEQYGGINQTENKCIGTDAEKLLDKKQEGQISAVQIKQSPAVLLEIQNKTKPDIKSPAKRIK